MRNKLFNTLCNKDTDCKLNGIIITTMKTKYGSVKDWSNCKNLP